MIYAASAAEVEQRRRAFIRKWRLKCKTVANSLEEAGDRLFTTRLPLSQWRSARTTNAIERLHEVITVEWVCLAKRLIFGQE
jgi:putative transposase